MAGELGYDTGPFVNVAAFCDRALREQDGVLSLIRVIDQLTVQAEGLEAPDELPLGSTVQTTLVVMLKRGEARGSQRVQVVIEHPSGERRSGPELSVNMQGGPNGGANIVMPVMLQLSSAGLYWAEILVNHRLLAKVPLDVIYQFMRPGTPPES